MAGRAVTAAVRIHVRGDIAQAMSRGTRKERARADHEPWPLPSAFLLHALFVAGFYRDPLQGLIRSPLAPPSTSLYLLGVSIWKLSIP